MFRSQRILGGFLLAAARNPYSVLGITSSASQADIKRAHRVLVKKYHPDSKTGDEEKFKEIQAAYETLEKSDWVYDDAPHGAQPSPDGSAGNWNPPGSTNENYLSKNKRLAAQVRLLVVWCVSFVLLRYLLSAIFPDLEGRRKAREWEEKIAAEMQARQAAASGGASGGGPILPEKIVVPPTQQQQRQEQQQQQPSQWNASWNPQQQQQQSPSSTSYPGSHPSSSYQPPGPSSGSSNSWTSWSAPSRDSDPLSRR